MQDFLILYFFSPWFKRKMIRQKKRARRVGLDVRSRSPWGYISITLAVLLRLEWLRNWDPFPHISRKREGTFIPLACEAPSRQKTAALFHSISSGSKIALSREAMNLELYHLTWFDSSSLNAIGNLNQLISKLVFKPMMKSSSWKRIRSLWIFWMSLRTELFDHTLSPWFSHSNASYII